jgi:hypothetical protein
LKPSSEALALGQALVEQLELDDRRDLLARWMASDIALKMDAARAPDATEAAREACADAIYRLWKHRADLPSGRRPLESLEKVAELILALDPANRTPYYCRPAKPPGQDQDKWLEAAEAFDLIARTLITYCLQQAAVGRGLEPEGWVAFAEAASLEAPERLVVRILYGSADGKEDPNAEIHRKADRLKEKLADLALLRKASAMTSADLRAQLAALGPLPPRPKDKKLWASPGARERPTKRRKVTGG